METGHGSHAAASRAEWQKGRVGGLPLPRGERRRDLFGREGVFSEHQDPGLRSGKDDRSSGGPPARALRHEQARASALWFAAGRHREPQRKRRKLKHYFFLVRSTGLSVDR